MDAYEVSLSNDLSGYFIPSVHVWIVSNVKTKEIYEVCHSSSCANALLRLLGDSDYSILNTKLFDYGDSSLCKS